MQKPISGPNLGPWPSLGYIDSALDRAAERRVNLEFLSARFAEDTSGFYLVGGEMIVLKAAGSSHDPLFHAAEIASLARESERIFLGLLKGAARFGLPI